MTASEAKILSAVNMTHKSLDEGVEHLLEWLSKQPHLPLVADKEHLKGFIVGSKSVERAKEKLDRYYSSRTKHPAIFGGIRDPTAIEWQRVEKIVILPGLCPNGEQVVFLQSPYTKKDIEAYSNSETARAGFMLADILVRTTPISGGLFLVMDCKDVCMEFLSKLVTTHTSAIFNIIQHVIPIRFKGFICFNIPSLTESFFNNVFKLFFSEKLRERVFVYSDQASLSKHIPMELLPKDYGGQNPTLEELLVKTRKDMEKNKNWFINEGSIGSDESKRIKTEGSSEEVQGTFRKLEID